MVIIIVTTTITIIIIITVTSVLFGLHMRMLCMVVAMVLSRYSFHTF